jgi:hypothetical protein
VVQQASEMGQTNTEKRLPIRKCQYPPCGVVFEPKRINQKYHQPACRQADWRRRHGQTFELPCPHCGGPTRIEVWITACDAAASQVGPDD